MVPASRLGPCAKFSGSFWNSRVGVFALLFKQTVLYNLQQAFSLCLAPCPHIRIAQSRESVLVEVTQGVGGTKTRTCIPSACPASQGPTVEEIPKPTYLKTASSYASISLIILGGPGPLSSKASLQVVPRPPTSHRQRLGTAVLMILGLCGKFCHRIVSH